MAGRSLRREQRHDGREVSGAEPQRSRWYMAAFTLRARHRRRPTPQGGGPPPAASRRMSCECIDVVHTHEAQSLHRDTHIGESPFGGSSSTTARRSRIGESTCLRSAISEQLSRRRWGVCGRARPNPRRRRSFGGDVKTRRSVRGRAGARRAAEGASSPRRRTRARRARRGPRRPCAAWREARSRYLPVGCAPARAPTGSRRRAGPAAHGRSPSDPRQKRSR